MVDINWKPSPGDLRKFGLTLLIGFGLIGGILFLNHPGAAKILWAAAGAVGLLALAWPAGSLPFFFVWMGLAFVLGSVMSRVALFLIFFGVLTPVALVFKLMGRDALKLKKGRRDTYWEDHPKIEAPSSYDHLF